MTTTNVFFKCISMLSRRLKGKWSLRRRQGFHSILTISFTLRCHSTSLSNWYNLSLIFAFTNGGENKKGSPKSLFLAINAKGGENIKPKAKGPHHQLQKFDLFTKVCFFQLISCDKQFLQLVWYFQLVYLKIDFQN
jgi:hypothetical protein